MEFLQGFALISGAALGTFVVGCLVLQFWLRDAGRPLLVVQALRRQSDEAAQRAEKSGGRAYALAVQRCLACTEAAQCQAWLWSGARDGYQPFCPNAAFIERMRH